MYHSTKSKIKIQKMKKIQMQLKTFERKKTFLLVAFTLVLSTVININTKEKLDNGYQFFLSFFGIYSNVLSFIFLMLVINAQEEPKGKNPFYLFKYVTYVFLIILFIAPFLYLWSMGDVIMQLKW
jgi:hypothetical protein